MTKLKPLRNDLEKSLGKLRDDWKAWHTEQDKTHVTKDPDIASDLILVLIDHMINVISGCSKTLELYNKYVVALESNLGIDAKKLPTPEKSVKKSK